MLVDRNSSMQNLEIPIAKKRGRKPKGTIPIDLQQQSQAQPSNHSLEKDNDAVIVHKKRGRKPKQKDPVSEQSSIVKPPQTKKNEPNVYISKVFLRLVRKK